MFAHDPLLLRCIAARSYFTLCLTPSLYWCLLRCTSVRTYFAFKIARELPVPESNAACPTSQHHATVWLEKAVCRTVVIRQPGTSLRRSGCIDGG